jgi:hypothetical protein
MGRPNKKLELTPSQYQELEEQYKNGKTHALRKRAQMMLLKHQGKSSLEIAGILGCCEVVVNTWRQRYELEGLDGLATKPGRGRKPILDDQYDLVHCKLSFQPFIFLFELDSSLVNRELPMDLDLRLIASLNPSLNLTREQFKCTNTSVKTLF